MRGSGVRVDLVRPGARAVSALPPLVRNLCDDAAVFPPGLVPLPEAVAAHRRYRESWFAGMIGPLVLPVSTLGGFLALRQPVPVCLTFPDGPELLPAALREAPGLRAAEIAVPAGLAIADLVRRIEKALDDRRVDVAVEVPRDDRRDAVLDALAGTPYRAKFRTGPQPAARRTRRRAGSPGRCGSSARSGPRRHAGCSRRSARAASPIRCGN